mgnify:CR=1 FL=1
MIYKLALNIIFALIVCRFLQLAPLTEGLRNTIEQHSKILTKLIQCPHCLFFWTAMIGASLLSESLIEFGVLLLIGWRGGFHVNKIINRRGRRRPSKKEKGCSICGLNYERKFYFRENQYFCSLNCWFDYLKNRQQTPQQVDTENKTIIPQEVYPVTIESITPNKAKELLDEGNGYVYIDVRSINEYEIGHPSGAYNIPIMHRQGGAMIHNTDFVSVVEKNFSHETKLLLGCQIGARSMKAAEALAAAGFTNLCNVEGGFGGVRDTSGKLIQAGWAESGLPTEKGTINGTDYISLSEK